MALVISLDHWVGDSTGANRGMPRSSLGDLMSPSLANGAFFTSKWYSKGQQEQQVIAYLYTGHATNAGTVAIEETFDNTEPGSTPTVHNSTTQASAVKTLPFQAGGSIHVAQLTVRVMAPHFRFVVTNTGAGAWVSAKLWGKTVDKS